MEIEERIGKILSERGLKLAVSESCTGGLICHRITNISGSSNYFQAGFVTYSNESKSRFLGVDEKVLEEKGAVSEDVAKLMAEGVRRVTGCDIGISVTGIAGPLGGTPEKPVGLVFIGLSTGDLTVVRRYKFRGERLDIKDKASEEALKLLLDYLEGRI